MTEEMVVMNAADGLRYVADHDPGRKFEVSDVVNDLTLVESARVWLMNYVGNFEYLSDMRAQMLENRKHKHRPALSYPQWKGVLNCMRVEISRQAPPRPQISAIRPTDWDAIPDGYYAVGTEPNLVFFRIKTVPPQQVAGGHAGYRKVQQVIGSKPARLEYLGTMRNLSFQESGTSTLLDLIGRDPKAAAMLYAEKIGCCYACNATLTDPESRRLGIGPECRKQRGI